MDKNLSGVRVSGAWHTVLTEAAQHVTFQLNSGRRTKTQQEALIRQKGVWSPTNPTGAAAYSPNAPHIRVGREDHALDVDTRGNGNIRLAAWLREHGCPVDREIPQEPWHLEARSERALKDLAETIRSPTLRKGRINRPATRSLQVLLRNRGYTSVRVNGKFDWLTRIAVRKFQRKNGIKVTADTTVGSATWRALRA